MHSFPLPLSSPFISSKREGLAAERVLASVSNIPPQAFGEPLSSTHLASRLGLLLMNKTQPFRAVRAVSFLTLPENSAELCQLN